MTISKSDYLLFLKHPAWLWLKKHDKAKLPEIDPDQQAIIDAGKAFEPYAEKLFPDGVKLGFSNYAEYETLPEWTRKALESGARVVFQGRFEAGQITCICDVIVKVADDTLDLYEIKSSTRPKTEHEYDLAFQLTVLESCGYKVRNVFVINVNNKYVRDGEVNFRKLTYVTNITDAVREKRSFTERNIAKALRIASSPELPSVSPLHASSTAFKEWVKIYREIENIESESIYDLFLVNLSSLKKLEALGVTKLTDIPDGFALTNKQKLQILATKLNKEIVKKSEIEKFLSKLVFPVYFFDYETFMSTVPHFDGLRPYQNVPFQYSLHVLEFPGAEIKQFTHLHREDTNPAKELSQSLKKHIGPSGSIIVWNQSFEKKCNEVLAGLEPEFADFYKQVNDRIVDLMLPFYNSWYVHKDFKGSASLKSVLPVMIPEMSYSELDISGGSTAQRIWMETIFDGKHEDEKEKIFNDLEKYCGMDTLAMVEIYKKLVETVEKRT